MAGDNLTISFQADSSKFFLELQKIKNEIGKTQRDLNNALKVGNVSGAEQASKQLDTLARSSAKVRSEMAATYRVIGDANPWKTAIEGATTLTRGLGGVAQATSSLSEMLGKGGKFGLAAGAAALLVGEIVAQVKGLAEASRAAAASVSELRETAKGLNIPTEQLERLYAAGAAKNIPREDIDRMLRGAQQLIAQAQIEQIKETGQLPGGPQIFRGGRPAPSSGDIQVFRGGQQAPISGDIQVFRGGQVPPFDTIWQQLRLDPRQYMGAGGLSKFLEDASKSMERFGDSATGAGLAGEIFGKKWVQGLSLFKDLPKELQEADKTIRETGGYTSERVKQQAEDIERAGARMDRSIQRSAETRGTAIGETMLPGFEATTQAAAKITETLEKAPQKVGEDWAKMSAEVAAGIPTDQIQTNSADIQNAYSGAFANIGAAWDALVSKMSSGLPVPNLPLGGAGEAAAAPFAVGGSVPGSGSGDTVPAMLTPGEFVNRVASVRYYGAGLFNALNARMIPRSYFDGIGYALGGLVDSIHAPARHAFAEGGAVPAGGHVTVDFKLGGNTFTMNSERAVASRLVNFARSEQMRSAGIKPSWVS